MLIMDYNNSLSSISPKRHIIYSLWIILISFFTIFIVALAFAIKYEIDYKSEYSHYNSQYAYVTHFVDTSEGKRACIVYEVNKFPYVTNLDYYTFTLKAGDMILIKYDVSNPYNFIVDSNEQINILIIFIIVLCLVQIPLYYQIVNNLRYSINIKKLKDNGKRINLRIIGYKPSRNRMFGFKPNYLILYDYRSNTQYLSYKSYITYKKFVLDSKIDVYVDEYKENVYFIDSKTYLHNEKYN